MSFELPAVIETPDQLQAVIYEAERYRDWLRATNTKEHVGQKGAAADEPIRAAETQVVITAWQGDRAVSATSLEELLTVLRSLKRPILHLVLAGLVPPAVRRRLVEWVRANGHPQALVQLTADSTIGGGVVIRTPDHIYDESFRTKLLAHRDGFIKALQNVR